MPSDHWGWTTYLSKRPVMKLPSRIALSGMTVAALALTTLISAPAAQAADNVNYPDPGKPYSTVNIKVGNHTDKLWLKQISTRTLELEGKPTQWKARYDVQVRDGSDRVLLDANLSIYKVNWIYVHFNTSKRYASDSAMLSALAAATADGTETNARDEFKNIYDSLGKFRTKDGKLQAPRSRANWNPQAYSDMTIASGNHENRVWVKALSDRTLDLGAATDADRGAAGDFNKARYDVQVRNAEGIVLFDQNYTVYRLDYLLRHAPMDKHYASDSELVQALNRASALNEPKARAAFKDRYGTLGQFKTADGKTQAPKKLPEDA